MCIHSLLILGLLASCTSIISPSFQLEVGIGNEKFSSIAKLDDGNFVAVGGSSSYTQGGNDVFVVKFDEFGNILVATSVGSGGEDEVANDIVSTSDGGCVIIGNEVGGDHDAFAIKLDSELLIEWIKMLGGDASEYGFTCYEAISGCLVFILETSSTGWTSGGVDAAVFNLDIVDGSTNWMKSFGTTVVSGHDGIFGTIQLVPPGDEFISVGYADNSGVYNGWIVRYKWNDVIYSKKWGTAYTVFRQIVNLEDGTAVIGGYTESSSAGGRDWVMLKINVTDGTVIWDSVVGTPGRDELNGFRKTEDGGFLGCGFTDKYSTSDLLFMKFNSTGGIEWSQLWNTSGVSTGAGSEFANCLELVEDDGGEGLVFLSVGRFGDNAFISRISSSEGEGCGDFLDFTSELSYSIPSLDTSDIAYVENYPGATGSASSMTQIWVDPASSFDCWVCSDPNYYGEYCNLTECFGISSNSSEVCSGNGTCVGFNNCSCGYGWIGELCNISFSNSYFEHVNGRINGNNAPGNYSCNSTAMIGGRAMMGGWLFGSLGNEFIAVFGGYGVASLPGVFGKLSDLWKYNFRTSQWCFVKGSQFVDQDKNEFGENEPSVFDPQHLPSGRSGFSTFVTHFSFFVFGGDVSPGMYSLSSGTGPSNSTNELWELQVIGFSTNEFDDNQWRLLHTEEEENTISSRSCSTASKKFEDIFHSISDPVYIFGGGSYSFSNNSFTLFNDLWKYNILTNEFQLLKPGDLYYHTFNNLTLFFDQLESGEYNQTVNPPHRFEHVSWVGSNGHVYIFGGSLSVSSDAKSNDVWIFNTSVLSWAWISGGSSGMVDSVIFSEDLFDFDPLNLPSERSGSFVFLNQDLFIDEYGIEGSLVFGGIGCDGTVFSDMWFFSNILMQFKFLNGSLQGNQKSSIMDNEVGGRSSGVGVVRRDNVFFIFGGMT